MAPNQPCHSLTHCDFGALSLGSLTCAVRGLEEKVSEGFQVREPFSECPLCVWLSKCHRSVPQREAVRALPPRGHRLPAISLPLSWPADLSRQVCAPVSPEGLVSLPNSFLQRCDLGQVPFPSLSHSPLSQSPGVVVGAHREMAARHAPESLARGTAPSLLVLPALPCSPEGRPWPVI